MSDPRKGSNAGHGAGGQSGDPVVVERVQELTWALIDEQISDDEMTLLDNLLLSDDKARDTYVGCVQLHTDLAAHFAAPATQTTSSGTAKSPILGFLNSGLPPLGLESPAEDAKS